MGLDQEILDVIKKQLPQQAGELIQSELADLDRIRSELKISVSRADTLAREKADAMARLARADSEIKAHEDLSIRAAAVLLREQKKDLQDLEVRMAELRRKDAYELVQMVFRSPVFRERVTGMIPFPVEGSPGGQYGSASAGYPSSGAIDKTTERTVT